MTTNSGKDRYPGRRYAERDALPGDHPTLLRPMSPVDVYIEVKRLLQLDDDELLQAFAAGAAMLAESLADGHLVEELTNCEAAISAATEVTRSRLTAWRKRGREMTWDELRVFLLGARGLVLETRDD